MSFGSVDLHVHSSASDGAFAPAEVARRAASAGLTTLALSDHDTTAGLEAFAAAGGVDLIPAIELTCRVRKGPKGTVHVLGYGIDPESSPLQDLALRNRLGKQAQIRGILEKLKATENIAIDWQEVAGDRGEDAYVGRHHIAGILVRRGLVRTRLRAFRRFLRSERVPVVDVAPAEDALAAIHGAGGVSVFAHPNQEDLDHHLRPLVTLGVQGIEVYRPRVMERRQAKLVALAEKHDLLVTGGSDWHGHHPEGALGDWRPPETQLTGFLERVRG